MTAAVVEDSVSPAAISPGVVAAGNTPTQTTAAMNQTHNNPSNKKASSFEEKFFVPQTYTTEVEDDTNKEDNNNSSYWYLLLTTYAPIIALWFWTSLLELATVIHTFVLGQLVKLVEVEDISKWVSETIPPWLEVILFQSASPNNALKASSSSDHAWPPPALKALALLTIVALVVHPEGLTWILLGKLRDAIYSFFSALGNSVEFLLNDYGVFPTIIAATTLGAMFFLAFVVIRTLSPKRGKNYSDKHNNTLHNERRKKKKKGGNARHRNNHHNHRSNNNNNSRIKTTLRSRSQDVENEKVETDSTTEAIPCSPIPSPPPADVPENNILSLTSSSPLEKSLDNPLEVPSISTATASATILDNNSIESSQETAKNVPTDKRISIGSSKSAAKENHMNTNKTRRRVTSASTADTTPLSDDQSCGSTSVRSFPSVSVNSNRSAGKKTKNTTPRRLKRHGTVKSPKSTERNSGKKNMNNHATSVESPGTTSRWDALKPNNGNAGKNNNNNSKNSTHGVHHSHSNGTTGNNKKQNQRQRGNSRRNANGRKGRPHPKSLAQNDDPSVASDKLRVNQSRANTEAPSIGSMRQESKTFCPNNPFAPSASQSSPTPPPGFQNSSHYEFGTKSSSHQYSQQQQYTNDNLTAAPLFGSPLAVRSPQDGSSNIAGVSPKFFNNSESTARTIQENPFRSDVPAISGSLSLMENHSYQRRHQSNIDSQIEADLQELGGQMAGSILDF